MLAGMAEEIEEILNARKIPLDPKPIIGTLPTGRVNGIALKVPDTDQIIVLIEDGLFGFANLAAKVVCRAFPILGEEDGHLNFSTDDDGWRKELSAKPEISERFVEALVCLPDWWPSAHGEALST